MARELTHGASADSVGTRPRVAAQPFLRRNVPILALIGLLVVSGVYFSLASDTFLTLGNFLNIVRQSAPALILAVSMTMVMTTRGIDLSVGSLTAMVGGVGAVLMRDGWSVWAAIVVMCAIGVVAGSVNGFFVAYQGIPAFIVTLAGFTAFRGIALILTEGFSIPMRDERFVWLGQGTIRNVPVPVVIALVFGIIGWLVFNKTPFGMRLVAVGSNPEATRRSGVNTAALLLRVYVISGLAAAVAAIVIAARLGAGSSNAGLGLELEVITGVVLGGTSLFGGIGTMTGSLLGVFLIAMIANGLILLRLDPFYVPVVQGRFSWARCGCTPMWRVSATLRRDSF
ncbi:MAG: ABC transporter permease [Chloroflexi bacterium]|nr:ABC transporter permease [Chloroflexota bacterium]